MRWPASVAWTAVGGLGCVVSMGCEGPWLPDGGGITKASGGALATEVSHSEGETGGASSGGSSTGIALPSASTGGATDLGLGGAPSAPSGGQEVVLDAVDAQMVTSIGGLGVVTELSEFARLAEGWTFSGLELLGHQAYSWALAQSESEARLLVFDTHQCGGPVGQIALPDELVQDRRLVLGEEALLSCDDQTCDLVDGIELEVRATLAVGDLSWVERSGATVCVGNEEILMCRRGDGVISDVLPWSQESTIRGRLADVGNCAVFETSQVCMTDTGAWHEVPLAIGPPPPPTCETLWHAAAFELSDGSLSAACAGSSAPPVAETRSVCGTTTNVQRITQRSYFATCSCVRVG